MATNHDMSGQAGPEPRSSTQPGELTQGLRLAAIALASAVVTATVVIGAGGVWLDRSGQAAQAPNEAPVRLIRTSG